MGTKILFSFLILSSLLSLSDAARNRTRTNRNRSQREGRQRAEVILSCTKYNVRSTIHNVRCTLKLVHKSWQRPGFTRQRRGFKFCLGGSACWWCFLGLPLFCLLMLLKLFRAWLMLPKLFEVFLPAAHAFQGFAFLRTESAADFSRLGKTQIGALLLRKVAAPASPRLPMHALQCLAMHYIAIQYISMQNAKPCITLQ